MPLYVAWSYAPQLANGDLKGVVSNVHILIVVHKIDPKKIGKVYEFIGLWLSKNKSIF